MATWELSSRSFHMKMKPIMCRPQFETIVKVKNLTTCRSGAMFRLNYWKDHYEGRLNERSTPQHISLWLLSSEDGVFTSAMCSHLATSGHRIDPDSAFQIVSNVPPNRSVSVHLRTIDTAEAISTPMFNLDLYVHKHFVQALNHTSALTSG